MFRYLTIAVACSALIACGPPAVSGNGGGGGGGGGGAIPTSGSALKQGIAGAYCSALIACEFGRAVQAVRPSRGEPTVDMSSCIEMMTAEGSDIDRIGEAFSANRVTVDEAGYTATRSALLGGDCSLLRAKEVTFGAMVSGTVEPGAGCHIDAECADGEGVGACSGAQDSCGTCRQDDARIPRGGDCSGGGRCIDGTECGDGGTCVPEADPRGLAGDACDDSPGYPIGDCHGGQNLICINDVCTEADYSSRPGAECGGNGVLCEGGLVCSIVLFGERENEGTCAQPKPLGQTCLEETAEALIGTACVSGAYCSIDTGNCEAQAVDGEACESDNNCLSDHCPNDTCQSPYQDNPWELCQ